MSLEILVGVMEDDVGDALQRRDRLPQLGVQHLQLQDEAAGIVTVAVRVRGVAFRQRGGHGRRHDLGIVRIEPDMRVDRSLRPVAVAVPVTVPVIMPAIGGLCGFTGMSMIMLMRLERAPFPHRQPVQTFGIDQPHHPGPVGQHRNRLGEEGFQRRSNPEDQIGRRQSAGVGRPHRIAVRRGCAGDQQRRGTDPFHHRGDDGMDRLDRRDNAWRVGRCRPARNEQGENQKTKHIDHCHRSAV